MVNDAKSHAAEDKKKREMVDARNHGDQLVYQTEKNLADMGDKLTDDDKSKLETAVGRLKESLKGENVDEIKSSTEALNQVWNEMASKMYQQAGPEAAEAGAQSESGPSEAEQSDSAKSENVEEADFEVVDDDKAKS